MTKLLRVAPLLAVLMLVSASPAAAGNAMRATLQPTTVNVIFDPAVVAATCGPEFPQAVIQDAGSGQFTSDVYSGPVVWSDQHCTLLRVDTKHDVAVALIHHGLMELETPSGDVLHLAYKAPGTFKGDQTLSGSWEHRGNGPFTVVHGTGVFADASGHGHIGVFDASGDVALDLNGSLRVGG